MKNTLSLSHQQREREASDSGISTMTILIGLVSDDDLAVVQGPAGKEPASHTCVGAEDKELCDALKKYEKYQSTFICFLVRHSHV